MPGGMACPKCGVACSNRIRCGMGGRKLKNVEWGEIRDESPHNMGLPGFTFYSMLLHFIPEMPPRADMFDGDMIY